MTDRPLPDAVIATFQYRHEAEFAAGFLTDAGIPFRLQVDDAGGAVAGVTVSNPARIWVRADDVEEALELLEVEDGEGTLDDYFESLGQDDASDDVPATGTFIRAPERTEVMMPPRAAVRRGDDPPLCGMERVVSGVLAVLCGSLAFAVGPTLGATLGAALWTGALVVLALVFGASALAGRAWGPFRSILRSLSGVAP